MTRKIINDKTMKTPRKTEQECIDKFCTYLQSKKTLRMDIEQKLLSLVVNARPNSESSLFPDFLFDGGFIEHFQVSAAKESRKGSEHNVAISEFERESEVTLQQETNEFLQLPPRENPAEGTYGLKVITHDMVSPKYSYNDFIKSFKRNFDRHILSLQKYTGEKSIGIFLIELVGANITIMHNNCFRAFYRLAVDQELLTYIQQYADYLKYIIFLSADRYEILELKEIPKLLHNIPQGLTFGVGKYTNVKLRLFIDI